MALLTAIVDVQDSTGASVVPSNSDGTRPLVKLKADASLTTSAALSGDTAVVTLGGGTSAANVVAAIAGQAIAPASVTTTAGATIGTNASVAGNLAVTGTITHGAAVEKTGTTTTTGNASSTVLTLAVAANSFAVLGWEIIGGTVATGQYYQSKLSGGTLTTGGSPALTGSATETFHTGLPCLASGAWAAGTTTFTARGPQATVTGSAAGTAGVVRLTVSGGLDASLSTLGVDVSGIVGTTEGNGTNLIATYVDATHLELAGTVWANAWISGGTVVLHTPPAMTWSAKVTAVITPAP